MLYPWERDYDFGMPLVPDGEPPDAESDQPDAWGELHDLEGGLPDGEDCSSDSGGVACLMSITRYGAALIGC